MLTGFSFLLLNLYTLGGGIVGFELKLRPTDQGSWNHLPFCLFNVRESLVIQGFSINKIYIKAFILTEIKF